MNLLLVTTIPETLEAFLLPFAEHFRAAGWTVGGMANAARGNAACQRAFDRLHDVAWSRNPLAPANLRAAGAVRAVVAAEGYDLVHVHTPVASFVTRYALRRNPQRPAVVYTAHGFHFHDGGHPLANAVFRILERQAGAWTDELVVINREDEAAARRYGIVPADRLHFIPGIGIDVTGWEARPVPPGAVEAVRAELQMPAAAPLLLMIAEFTPNKRQADALQAFARLPREAGGGVAPHLVFAGVGPTLDDARRLAEQLGVVDRVHFLGYRRDVPVLLRAADLLLLTSAREGLPRSVMEAMVLGTPVVASDVRGVRDLVGDGHGKLVRVGDVQGLCDAIAYSLAHRREMEQMATRARAHVASYDVGTVLQQYEEVYRAALRRRGVVPAS